MADTVYKVLDRMVPALEDLQIKGIFTAPEIKAIVKKRRDFEFLMRRKLARKADFLRYLEYEMNLEALRKLRKAKLGSQARGRPSIGDLAGRQHIHFIYERALRKFRGDLTLWLQYLDHCISTKSSRQLSRSMGQALQLFPREPGLWIKAASWEFFNNCNPTSARALMQRGIRVNDKSPLLYHQYFRLEMFYVQKLRGRHELLGLQQGGNKGEQGTSDVEEDEEEEDDQGGGDKGLNVPELEEEKEVTRRGGGDGGGIMEPMEESVERFYRGEVPLLVYRNAILHIPQDVGFRLGFIPIAVGFPWAGEVVVEEILASIGRDFDAEEEVRARAMYERLRGDEAGGQEEKEEDQPRKNKSNNKKRRRSSSGGDAVTFPGRQVYEDMVSGPVRRSLKMLEGGVESLRSAKMWRYYLEALTEALLGTEEEGDQDATLGALQASFAQAEKSVGLEPPGYMEWADVLVRADKSREALEVVSRGLDKTPTYQGLWRIKLKLLSQEEGARHEEVKGALDKVLSLVPLSEGQHRTTMWGYYLDWLVGYQTKLSTTSANSRSGGKKRKTKGKEKEVTSDSDDDEDEKKEEWVKVTSRAFERALASSVEGRGALADRYYQWAKGQGAAHRAVETVVRLISPSSTNGPDLLDFLLRVLEEEKDGEEEQFVRGLWERAVGLFPRVEDLWDGYEEWETARGQPKRASHVRWRKQEQQQLG